MNWLDWTLFALMALAAFKGFSRGGIVEICSLLALIVGIWAATRFSTPMAEVVGLDAERTVLAFVLTFIIVLVGVHLLARMLTALIDLAQLGLPNRIMGLFIGALRSAFTLSVLLNLSAGWSDNAFPPEKACAGSALHAPLLAFAPFVIPSLGNTKWVKDVLEHAADKAGDLMQDPE